MARAYSGRACHRDDLCLGRVCRGLGIEHGLDLLDFDEALRGLEAEDEIGARAVRVVELRFFCGLSMEEIAEVTGTPLRTVERDYKTARVWLQDHLA